MSIDLGNTPVGTPPTSGEKLQMRLALGIGASDSPAFATASPGDNSTTVATTSFVGNTVGEGLMFGMEFLSAFHKRLMGASEGANNTATKIVMTGDSTTYGHLSDPASGAVTPYQLNQLIEAAAERNGLRGVTAVNRGQSGKTMEEWNTTYLSGDLALTPDLMVCRWGLNDPVFGRTVAQVRTSLRAALTTIRASRALNSLSIVLCTPSTTNDTPNGRDAAYHESLRAVIKEAARDFQCAYLDVYSLLKSSAYGIAGGYMDNFYGDGRSLHPLNVMNLWICTFIEQLIFPEGLKRQIGENQITNVSGFHRPGNVSSDLGTFSKGFNINKSSSGFPYTGIVTTIRNADGDYGVQTVYDTGIITQYATRLYRSGAWQPFSYHRHITPGTLVTRNSLNVKAVAETSIYTVPTGQTAVITAIVYRVATASAITVGPTIKWSVASGTGDVAGALALTDLTAVGQAWNQPLSGKTVTIPAGSSLLASVDTASTGSSQTFAIDVIGYTY